MLELSSGDEPVEERHIDFDQMKFVHKKSDNYFFNKYKDNLIEGENGRHLFFDNGANVLAVAHLDTVIVPEKTFHFNKIVVNLDGGTQIKQIKTPTLDDRLGVYTIMDLMPQILGTNWADILLTEGEETGNSTAKDFSHPDNKQYNWMVEFDRKASSMTQISKWANKPKYDYDIVMYEYLEQDADEIKGALHDAGFINIGKGSFTDIAYLNELNCKGINVAVGYHDNHSTKAFMWLTEYLWNINNFVKFYKKYQGTHFPHKKVVRKTYTHKTNNKTWREWNNNYKQGNLNYNGYGGGTRKTWEPEYDKSGWIKECPFKPGDLVEYSSSSGKLYVINNINRAKSVSQYKRYYASLSHPDGTPYLTGVLTDVLRIVDSACTLCFSSKLDTIIVYDTDASYINLCLWCHQEVIGLAECCTCKKPYHRDELIALDGYPVCENCLFEEQDDLDRALGDSKLWIGDWVKMSEGGQLYEVVDMVQTKEGEIKVHLLNFGSGELLTNGGFGYNQDALTIVSKGERNAITRNN